MKNELYLLKNYESAFCVDIRFEPSLVCSISWLLHEGLYELSESSETSFLGLDGFGGLFYGSNVVTVINTGRREDISMSNLVSELIDAAGESLIRKAGKIFIALFVSKEEKMSAMHKHLTQFEAMSGRFEYEYLLGLMPHYGGSEHRGVLILSN